jgi:hypothetical protein
VKQRPEKGTVATEPLPWWNYAVDLVQEDVRENIKRWNWDWIKSRIASRTVYIDIYKKVVKEETVTFKVR